MIQKNNLQVIHQNQDCSPFHGGDSGFTFDGQVLLSAPPTQQVIRVPAATLSSKPAVHVGAVATVTLPVGAAPTARVAFLHVLVEVCHVGLTKLTNHHFVSVVRLTHVLQGFESTRMSTHRGFEPHRKHSCNGFQFGRRVGGSFVMKQQPIHVANGVFHSRGVGHARQISCLNVHVWMFSETGDTRQVNSSSLAGA